MVRTIVVLCVATGQLHWLSSLRPLQSDFALGLACFIKVPSVCLHEGSSPPSVCWHHTEFCPLLWLLSEPWRQRQTSRCRHGELGILKGKLSFVFIWTFGFDLAFCIWSLILLQGLHNSDKTYINWECVWNILISLNNLKNYFLLQLRGLDHLWKHNLNHLMQTHLRHWRHEKAIMTYSHFTFRFSQLVLV